MHHPPMGKRKTTPREIIARKLRSAMLASPDLRTQSALARRVGVSQSTVARILNGQSDPQSDNLRRLADALGLDISDLYTDPVVSNGGSGLEAITTTTRRTPLVSWDLIEGWTRDVNALIKNAQAWLTCPAVCGARTFALRVRGGSMSPQFNDGDVIFCDPDEPVRTGRLVIARNEVGGEAQFRELVIEGRQRFLRRLNPAWPGPEVVALEPDGEIIAVVIGKWVQV